MKTLRILNRQRMASKPKSTRSGGLIFYFKKISKMIEKVKILLGIPNSDTSQDSRLLLILENLEEEFPLFKKEIRREKFFRKKFQNSCIPISYPFLQKILKINGAEISEKDYEILDNGEVFIKNFSLIPYDNVIIVEFESGFDKIPSKFLSDMLLLAQIEFSKES